MQFYVLHYINSDIKKEISFCPNHQLQNEHSISESWLAKSDFSSGLQMYHVTVWDEVNNVAS